MSSVGRNIPKWRSKGSGLSRCTHLGQAAQSTGGEGSSVDDGDGDAWKGTGESHKRIDEMFTFIYVQIEGRKERQEMFYDKSKETFRVQSGCSFTMRRGRKKNRKV